jgi:hypothetical protein
MAYRGRKRQYDNNGRTNQEGSKFQVENATFYFGGSSAPSGRGAPKRGRGAFSRGRRGFSAAGGQTQHTGPKAPEQEKFSLTDAEALDLIPIDLKSELPQFNLDVLVHKLKQTKSEKVHNDLIAVAYAKMAEVAESKKRVREAQKRLRDAKIKPKLSKPEKPSQAEGSSNGVDTDKKNAEREGAEDKEDEPDKPDEPNDYEESEEESGDMEQD